MAGLVPAIHAFSHSGAKNVDGQDKPGHDEAKCERFLIFDRSQRRFSGSNDIRASFNGGRYACRIDVGFRSRRFSFRRLRRGARQGERPRDGGAAAGAGSAQASSLLIGQPLPKGSKGWCERASVNGHLITVDFDQGRGGQSWADGAGAPAKRIKTCSKFNPRNG
jgi:hypothetical protein